MNEVTIKRNHLIMGAVVAILAIVAYVIAGPSPVKTATAAGGDPATACVAPSTSEVPTTATEPETSLETVTPPVVKEKHTHDSDGVKQKGLVNVNDTTVKDVVDITTGDILSNNLNNNEVDVTVTDVLNPVTSLLSTVEVL